MNFSRRVSLSVRNYSRRHPLWLSVLLGTALPLIGAPGESRADDLESLVKVQSGYWTSSRQLDGDSNETPTSAWARLRYQLSPTWSGAFEGWVGNRDFSGDGPDSEAREVYVDGRFGDLDVRAGKHIIAWGRADRLNPTDNLSARRFTTLTMEDDDQRVGTYAVRGTYQVEGYEIIGIWEPRFTPSEIPLRRLNGIAYERTNSEDEDAWALKLQQQGSSVDWSISYYSGPDRLPDLAPLSISLAGTRLGIFHNEIRVVGIDWATTSDGWGFRGELAHARTEDSGGNSFFVKNPYFYGVIGTERQLPYSISTNAQIFYKRVSNYRDPSSIADPTLRTLALRSTALQDQLDDEKYGVALRVSRQWRNNTLETELSFIHSEPRNDYVIRPQVLYRPADGWKVILGADVIRGPDVSFYGQLKDNAATYFMLEYSI